LDSNVWYSSYLQKYLERDVKTLKQIDFTDFQRFLLMLAARSGQLLNFSDMSRDLEISVDTARAWLWILEATYQVVVLRPYYRDESKRLAKAPRVYFTDVGMLCYLSGLRHPVHTANGPASGTVVETVVLSEIVKSAMNSGIHPQVYCWRTSNGAAVDIVIEREGRLIPVEVKPTSTPRPMMASGLVSFMGDYADAADRGWLVHMGSSAHSLAPGVNAVPIHEL
jgi:uncharacterized protein